MLKPNARPPDLKKIYDGIVKQVAEGADIDELLSKLPLEVYDKIIDADFNFDNLQFTGEQLKGIKQTSRAPRPTGLRYNKKYPQDKQDLYNSIIQLLTKQGAIIEPPERQNYGRIDFTLQGKKFRIVISNPTK